MSACFSFGLTAGNPIADASIAAGTTALWSGLPKLVVVLLGGFSTNFVWCVLLNLKNGTGYQVLLFRDPPRAFIAPRRSNGQDRRHRRPEGTGAHAE